MKERKMRRFKKELSPEAIHKILLEGRIAIDKMTGKEAIELTRAKSN